MARPKDGGSLPTMRTMPNDVALTCNTCFHSATADRDRLIAAGYGDVPLIRLRFRCAACGSRDVSAVVSGARDAGY